MPSGPMNEVIQYLRNALLLPEGTDRTDGQLLECFVSRRDPTALEALVRRHGQMVWGVCRRVLRAHQDAEDAFQATFLVLLRKAPTIVPREMVGNWLYGVAHQTALKARATRAKRQAREKQVIEMPEPAAREPQLWNDLQAVLDGELSRLPDKYRAVFVLCELEGKTGREAARQLGLPEGTAASRLSRARAMLAKRLARQGLMVSGGTLAAVLSAKAASASVPAGVTSSTIAALTQVAAGTAGAISPPVAALTEGVLKAMALNKLKTLTVVLLMVGACAAAAGTGMLAAQRSEPKPAAEARQLPAPDHPPKRVDRRGDPLPPGAIARLGTLRLRHSGMVDSVVFSPDGKTLASGDSNGEMRLWDAATGELLRAFVDQDYNRVTALAFSPDGKRLASNKGRLSLWDVATGTKQPGFAADYQKWAQSLAFSPDGQTVAVTADRDPLIRFFSTATGKLTSQIKEDHPWTIYAVAFSPDGKSLATAGEDSVARVWDLTTHKALHQFRLAEPVTDVAWSPDGKRLAAGAERTVTVWETATETKLHQFDQWSGRGTRSLAFSPDGKRLAAAGRIWDLPGGKEVGLCAGPHAGCVAYAPDGTALATAGPDGAIRLHDPDTGKELPRLRAAGGGGAFTWAAFTPNNRELLTLRLDLLEPLAVSCTNRGADRVQAWSVDGREVRDFACAPCGLTATLSPDGAVFAMAGADGVLTLWDGATGRRVRQFVVDEADLDRTGARVIVFSPDGRLVAAAGRGAAIRVWETQTGRLVQTLKAPRPGIAFLTFSGDGRRLVSVGDGNSAHYWDVATGKEWRATAVLPGPVRNASPDGTTWIMAIDARENLVNRSLHLCAIDSGKELLRLEDGGLSGLCAFAPDGRTIAVQDQVPFAFSAENTIRVIELATGGERVRFRGHRGRVTTLAFSPDGRTLVSGGYDNTALVWDLVGDGGPAAKDLSALWDKLGSTDAAKAHQAMSAFSRSPGTTLAWFRKHLPPIPKADNEQLAQLLKQLDDDRFAVREAAEAGLTDLAEGAAPALRQALDGKLSAEVRRRVTRLLEQLDEVKMPTQLRSLRAIEVLERMGTPEARKLLEDVAKGVSEARQTQEAKASLDRLTRKHGGDSWP
jgi:RNA polymerase sigma factor (sigma-70 family)